MPRQTYTAAKICQLQRQAAAACRSLAASGLAHADTVDGLSTAVLADSGDDAAAAASRQCSDAAACVAGLQLQPCGCQGARVHDSHARCMHTLCSMDQSVRVHRTIFEQRPDETANHGTAAELSDRVKFHP